MYIGRCLDSIQAPLRGCMPRVVGWGVGELSIRNS